ncbi:MULTISPECIES: GspE/PulE family protein [Leptolyngbya]|jgi:type IV pilus assembly protein PilB|uniref:Type II secretory pathway, ATPase PulE/Tfp pilus assembly pathway, ATPase PilB n=2 Tax=Leptolyngbya boryana TaxID=1184 RepID=A0A1Z4JKK3_LEPBY|nr:MULTISPECIES: GspE/PulE family protein [Leptolyngbya]BAY57251.1 type II secretory pathway, ATPase PulE/Tfp pilus assembly pathway, ATPase PilB [Leptolyngbya boryana NIES-2135]MBD1857397.1 type II/IV secretion system protein [Leptolyngbya sp. FACHB-1624]MBD2366999.1 type II/IV secretion system protein [Leptolyngbya sp. FACHB-161]MBD2373647.1 type II/IV secretion system protein [Leptolyngbya sp. FACHB-238]MBD2398056.1 type II/IV secretion system protein [Leptolyngbya sp. FACHB-239]
MTNSSSQRRALVVQNNFSPFGNKLIQSGYVNNEQMQQALIECRKSGRPLTAVLEALTGQQLSPDLIRQYKRQQLFELKILYGVESLDPELNQVSSAQVGQLIDTLIPIELCRRYNLIPLSQSETDPPFVLVAMVDPDNLAAQDELNRILRPKGIGLQRLVITIDDYQRLISTYMDARLEQEKQLEAQSRVDVRSDLEGLESLAELSEDDSAEMDLDAGAEADAAPIIALVNKILIKALQMAVSDIHIEPQEESLRIRFRKDGVLREAFEPFPKKIIPAVVARFKIISQLDIAERRAPQDGRIRRIYDGRKVDFRVNTLPSRYGEKVVLRILDNSATQLGLDKLITDETSLRIVQEMVKRPFGLMLVTGPTGSGKTTTLYSALAERNEPGVNISTAEDPIEYSLPGITQVQVIREKGMDFAAILRAFLRQDPDVILVGETRDKETAKTAIEAALTGHLVLTTLHTNDAAGAIARLDEMGVEPFMVSGALLGVVAQRLVRKVCDECRIPYQPSPEELARFGLTSAGDAQLTLYKANTLSPQEIQEARSKNQLCQKCSGVGYKGRLGVYEVMRVTEALQTLITEGAPTERIKEVAVEEGMQTLLAYSLDLVRKGLCTLEEIERVTFTDTGLEAELKAKRKTSLTCRTCGAEMQQDWLDCHYCTTPRFQD